MLPLPLLYGIIQALSLLVLGFIAYFVRRLDLRLDRHEAKAGNAFERLIGVEIRQETMRTQLERIEEKLDGFRERRHGQ